MYRDRAMQTAVADARASLRIFFDAWLSDREGYSDFRVLVIMPSSAYGRDYEELSDIRRDMAGFIGKTSSGKETPFLVADIADWRFMDGDRWRGGFTHRVMLDMPETDLPALRARFHEEPLP